MSLDVETCNCDNCNEATPTAETTRISCGEIYCDTCMNDVTFCCDNCGGYFHENDYGSNGNCENCEELYDDDDDSDRSKCENHPKVNDHGDSKDLVFIDSENLTRKTPLFGIELEVEYKGTNAKEAMDNVVYEAGTLFHLESDGSLSNGFEMVSDALPLSEHLNRDDKYKQLFANLSKNIFRSHDVSTCGLHVHISRKYLKEDEIKFICDFVANNRQFFKKLARRNENDYCIYKDYKRNKEENERYSAINLQNEDTLEFRIFKGTLKLESFMSSIELVDAVYQFAISKVKVKNFITFVSFVKYIKNYKYLGEYFESKGMTSSEIIEKVSKIEEITKEKENILARMVEIESMIEEYKNSNDLEIAE